LAVLAGAVLATAAQGQAVRPAAQAPGDNRVYRMEILNGPTRTVHYVGAGLSPGEMTSLNELERAENRTAYADSMLALKLQYVNGEIMNEPGRRYTQQAWYGRNLSLTSYDSSYANLGGYPGGRYTFGYPYYSPYNYGGYGYSGGYGTLMTGGTTTLTRSLANGVGDEGVLKNTLAPVIAQQATPEYAAAAARDYQTALARAASSDNLRAALNLPERGRIAQAGAETTTNHPVTLTLQGGKEVKGTMVREEPDWLVLRSGNSEITVRRSEVTMIQVDRGPDKKEK